MIVLDAIITAVDGKVTPLFAFCELEARQKNITHGYYVLTDIS